MWIYSQTLSAQKFDFSSFLSLLVFTSSPLSFVLASKEKLPGSSLFESRVFVCECRSGGWKIKKTFKCTAENFIQQFSRICEI